MAKQQSMAMNSSNGMGGAQVKPRVMHDVPRILLLGCVVAWGIIMTLHYFTNLSIIIYPYLEMSGLLLTIPAIYFSVKRILQTQNILVRYLWLWGGLGSVVFFSMVMTSLTMDGFTFSDLAFVVCYSYMVLLIPSAFLWMNKSEETLEKERLKKEALQNKKDGVKAGMRSPLRHLSLEQLHQVSNRLFGQEQAEKALLNAAKAHDGKGGKPFSALFCGASGVGKTQLAENVAQASGIKLTQFNMGEISGGTGMDNTPGEKSRLGRDMGKDALLGMPAGYVDSERGGLLTNALGEHPTGIFLFDEMEKAGSGIYDLFLNCLDKGWIKDARGKRYDCSGATFIFTTNVARDVDPELPETKIRDKMVRAGFRPELMGRINKAIVFKPLTPAAARELALSMFEQIGLTMKGEFKDAVPEIEWKPRNTAVDFFLNDLGYDVYGVRAIQKAVKELWVNIAEQSKDKTSKVVLFPCKHKAPKLARHELAMPLGKLEAIDLKALRKHITAKVKGQDHAVDTIIDQLEIREMGMVAKAEQPEGTFLFTGPSGTGKTEMVKQAADYLDRKFLVFNMGGFKDENGVNSFFGPPPGYAGSDKGGQLTQAVLDHPDAIILLDEIEKAHPKIWDAFMSVFDDGVVKDTSSGEEVSFSKTMLFMTSNIETNDMPEDELRDALRGSGYFRPEMVNRIEHVVAFKPLEDDVKRDIVRKVIAGIIDNYNRTNGMDIEVREAWVNQFAAEADFTNGVRDIQRKMQRELMKELKKEK